MPNGIARLNKLEPIHAENLTGTTLSSEISVPNDTRYIIISSDSTVPLRIINDTDGSGAVCQTLYPKGTGTAVGIYEELTICNTKLKIQALVANAKYRVEVTRLFTGV
tara:strand:- start:3940 stop:4263 length:324 start_codon:yes stop_codon:yes gene_type:complete